MAVLADLDDVDLEGTELVCHARQVGGLTDAAGVRAEFVAVHVGDRDQAVIPARRAVPTDQFAVESGRLE